MNERTFSRLIADLKSEDYTVVESAAVTLSSLRDENVRSLIDAVLSSESPVVQRVLLWTLRNYRIDDYESYLSYLVAADRSVREACNVLFMEGGKKAVDVLRTASSGSYEMQYAVAETLSRIRSPESCQILTNMLASSKDTGVSMAVASSLSVFRSPESTDALCMKLVDAPDEVQVSLLFALRGRVLQSSHLAQIMPYLSSSSPDVRAAAVYVLDAVTPDFVVNDDSSKVRKAFAECTCSPSLLLRLCRDSDPSVRTAAATSSAKQQIASTDLFIAMMKDEYPGVRRAAVEALGSARGEDAEKAVVALKSALHDSRPGIRAAAANALASIGGSGAKAALESAGEEKIPFLSGIIKNALSKFDTR